jgi:hypothetical protein
LHPPRSQGVTTFLLNNNSSNSNNNSIKLVPHFKTFHNSSRRRLTLQTSLTRRRWSRNFELSFLSLAPFPVNNLAKVTFEFVK